MPDPITKQINISEQERIKELFLGGKTHAEIGETLGRPRRTIMKLCKHLGLKRSRSEAGELKNKSDLDKPDIVAEIRELRNTKSLQEIADRFGSSMSSVQRICDKHQINLDGDKFKNLQACRMISAWTDEKRAIASKKSLDAVTPELRKKLSDNSKKLWKENRYRNVQAEKRSEQSFKISSIQEQLYDILDDLGVAYFREYSDKPNDPETVVGFYNFDCAIPRQQDTLLIECQGDYWHSLEKASIKDNQKRSYINNNFPGVYELKYIWEHEFKCYSKVVDNLKYWLGISEFELVDFDFHNISIMKISIKMANKLLDKYHYLSGCGRGGICYGAFLDGELVAVCTFSSLVRQNLPFDRKTSRELSRFCIHPKYQKKNFGSWLISRIIKILPNNIRTVLSYSDSTFNHIGALYRACNFTEDGTVRPDYWYVNESGGVMHKKAMYSHACKMGMKEREFAEQKGYKRVYGSEKTRFILER